MPCNISAAIIAGGAGKRFGGITKTKILVGGVPIITRVAVTLRSLFDEIIIAANDTSEFREFDDFILTIDQISGAGPLGGIHAALKASSNEAVFVFAGDMPFLNPEIIKDQITAYITGDYDVIVPRVENLTEPLHSIFSTRVVTDLERFIYENRNASVRDFLKLLRVGYLNLQPSPDIFRSFSNINSPSDLDLFNS